MSLGDIKSQDRAVDFLKKSIEAQRLSHSLLFFGPEAIGKKLTAMTLAKAFNCEVRGPLDCCDGCSSCHRITNFNHPDVHWIEPEGSGNKIKIERIRTMKERIALKPFEGKSKFFIIERSHFMRDEAANSILKTLEEPPKDSFIVLITDDLNKILPTLRSRCQWVLFSSVMAERLKGFLVQEYNLTDKDAHFLSHLSEGKIGKALTMKDKGSLKWKNEVLDKFSKESIIFMEDPFFFNNKREDVLSLVDIIVSWYRDLFVLKNSQDTSLLINVDRIDDIRSKTESLSRDKIKEILEEALKTRAYIERNVNPKLALSNLAGRIE